MKTSPINMYSWVQTNRKEMTKEEFLRKTGMDFDDFSHTYKKECREAWAYYQSEKPDEKPTLTREREKHLLRIIDVWKGRYSNLKKSLTPPTEVIGN